MCVYTMFHSFQTENVLGVLCSYVLDPVHTDKGRRKYSEVFFVIFITRSLRNSNEISHQTFDIR